MPQPTLFPDPPALLAAERARDAAMEQAAANAPAGWEARATDWLRSYLETHAEYVPDTANREGPEPPERRAWGGVVRRALRLGWMVKGGYAPRTQGHATMGPVYRSKLYGGGA
jgi:hypothetical protein